MMGEYNKAIEDMARELRELIYNDFNITLELLREVENRLKK